MSVAGSEMSTSLNSLNILCYVRVYNSKTYQINVHLFKIEHKAEQIVSM